MLYIILKPRLVDPTVLTPSKPMLSLGGVFHW